MAEADHGRAWVPIWPGPEHTGNRSTGTIEGQLSSTKAIGGLIIDESHVCGLPDVGRRCRASGTQRLVADPRCLPVECEALLSGWSFTSGRDNIMSLESTVALITGAQQGIGAAAAEVLAERGAKVVINYLDDEAAADEVKARIEASGGTAVTVPGDVANTADVANMIEAAESLGGINVLVNNAGIFPRVDFLEMAEDEWDSVFAVNLRAMFVCTQAAARHMVAAGRSGAIINLTSSAAHSGPPLGVHYASTKAGVIGFTRSLARALSPHGIRANAVAPGLTDTAQPRDGMTEEEIDASAASLPIGRIATARDIATTIAFLASSDSRHMTGQVLHVNGGQYFG